MDKIFLATIEAGNYLLTAWDVTVELATAALALEYAYQGNKNVAISELSWTDYANRHGVRVIELYRGQTEWT